MGAVRREELVHGSVPACPGGGRQGSERQEFRQDAWDEYGYHNYDEWYEDRWKYAMGASLTAATFRSLSCTMKDVSVAGVSYYQCGPTWYQRAYSGGSTTYVVVIAPAGH